MFNIQSLKKMATEKIARKFEQIFNWLPFNVYEEREMMIAMLIGQQSPEIEIGIGGISFEIEFIEKKTIRVSGFIDQFDEIFGVTNVKTEREIKVNVSLSGCKLFNRISESIRNQGKYEPVRVETKGRKSRFTFTDVMDMLNADVQGVRLTDIAQFYSTSCAVVTQILTGKSYQWASGITQESF